MTEPGKTFWVEHADTFSYEYTIVAQCDTREEAQDISDWYQARTGAMSEYRVLDRLGMLRDSPHPELIKWATEDRERKMQEEREHLALRAEEV